MPARSLILAVCGTRPEVVKMAPVVGRLRDAGQDVLLLFTGQHPDLAPQMLRELGLKPDIELPVPTAGLPPQQMLAAIINALAPVFAAHRPAVTLVQGDTVSTLAGALAAAYAGLPLAHVEAGLRTGDMAEPHPEEMHRRLIAPLASLHFAPTHRAAAALIGEGVNPGTVHVTGNSGIDALLETNARLIASPDLCAALEARFPVRPGRPMILATVHRRENHGERLAAIASGLAHIAASGGVEMVLPLHPGPAVQRLLRASLGHLAGVHLLPPVDHATMVWLMRRSQLLITDSGGLQEEAPALGLRTLVLRQRTERSEAVDAGASELVSIEPEAIAAAAWRQLSRPKLAPRFPFGDGRAAGRICTILLDFLRRGDRKAFQSEVLDMAG